MGYKSVYKQFQIMIRVHSLTAVSDNILYVAFNYVNIPFCTSSVFILHSSVFMCNFCVKVTFKNRQGNVKSLSKQTN